MMMKHRTSLVTLVLIACWAAVAVAQTDSITVRASTRYERSAFSRKLWGNTWRPVWNSEIRVPVLHLGTFAGGLEPFKQGGSQSKTLRMHGANGRTYVFRTIDKTLDNALPDELRKTWAGNVIQDQTSSLHPSGFVAAAPLADALGILNAPPTIVYMPDDERLGKYRKDFKNTLGEIEERPDEGSKGQVFAGAEDIVSTEKLLEKLEESMKNRLDSREYLKARLLDFILGDTDRGADQWRFARYDEGDFNIYRPIPRDRDYAFMRTEGFLTSMIARAYPKLTEFRPEFPQLRALIFMTREFDRSQLIDLPWAAWDSVVKDMQHRLTDQVIEDAIKRLPDPHRRLSGEVMRAGLKGRRAKLGEIAHQYYELVSGDADVFASDDNERAVIDRQSDGSVRVRIYREPPGINAATDGEHSVLVFDRTFLPDETDDIRVYMERGDDYVIVRGNVDHSIQLRVTGGEGDDVMVDSSRVASGADTRFYDATGHNTFVKGVHTDVISTPFYMPQPFASLDSTDEKGKDEHPRKISEERRGRQQDLANDQMTYVEKRTRSELSQTWGHQKGIGLLVQYRDGAGLIIGAGPTETELGFRRKPYEWQRSVRAMVGTENGKLGVQFFAARHFEPLAPWSVSIFAHATQLESNRFYGYGNDTPLGDVHTAVHTTLMMRDEIMVAPSINYSLGRKSLLTAGPVLKYSRPHLRAGGPAELTQPFGVDKLGQVGAQTQLRLVGSERTQKSQHGVDLSVGGSVYPALWDVQDAFGELHSVAHVFIPLGRPVLALRAGGKRVWGAFPVHEAAFLGAAEDLRGYQYERFAGDAAAYGTVELHMPLGRIELLTRGDFGLIGYSDAGRVWQNGLSAGSWHRSYGGGFWFGSLGQVLSVTYARGTEPGHLYFALGYPF